MTWRQSNVTLTNGSSEESQRQVQIVNYECKNNLWLLLSSNPTIIFDVLFLFDNLDKSVFAKNIVRFHFMPSKFFVFRSCLVSRAGCGIGLYRFLIIAFSSTFDPWCIEKY